LAYDDDGAARTFLCHSRNALSREPQRNEWLAELDIHLRGSRLREPVLETLGTNSFRIALAEKAADNLQPRPLEVLPDLIAEGTCAT